MENQAAVSNDPNSQVNLQPPVMTEPHPSNDSTFGPRRMSFFTLVLKTLAGFAGGIAGMLILVLIFLLTSSILQPVLSPAEAAAHEISPLFVFVLMAMIFSTSLIASIVGSLLLSYTERERYTRVMTALAQIFIVNLVIFAFVSPIYLSASAEHLELTAFAAGLQIILSATASTLVFELIHDYRYSLLSVYNTILAVLVSTAICFLFYSVIGQAGATVLLFASLPILWTMIGFFQGALTMFYYWLYENYGIDFLATTTSYGADYGIPDESEEEAGQPEREDVEGNSFLKQ